LNFGDIADLFNTHVGIATSVKKYAGGGQDAGFCIGYGIHGGLIIWNGKLVRGSDGVNVLVIRPLRSRHGPEVLEVISELYLRGRLLLNDGDDVELIINCC